MSTPGSIIVSGDGMPRFRSERPRGEVFYPSPHQPYPLWAQDLSKLNKGVLQNIIVHHPSFHKGTPSTPINPNPPRPQSAGS